jgi:pimeloyl-ACP methyl ester carboxylesterase
MLSPNDLKELVDYWQHKFKWREQEVKLNKFDQFKAQVDGVNTHFIHMRGKSANSVPIILTHGWPDSFYRFYKVIPMLTEPEKFGGKAEDSFDVIIPSLPGFGFSDHDHQRSFARLRFSSIIETKGSGMIQQ